VDYDDYVIRSIVLGIAQCGCFSNAFFPGKQKYSSVPVNLVSLKPSERATFRKSSDPYATDVEETSSGTNAF